jgi:hypothetical protein
VWFKQQSTCFASTKSWVQIPVPLKKAVFKIKIFTVKNNYILCIHIKTYIIYITLYICTKQITYMYILYVKF